MENGPRVVVIQRWVEGIGRDVMVVASLNKQNLYGCRIPMPGPGRWLEVFNSDVYENRVNPSVSGNGGSVQADGPGTNGLPCSAVVTVPANSVLVFAATLASEIALRLDSLLNRVCADVERR